MAILGSNDDVFDVSLLVEDTDSDQSHNDEIHSYAIMFPLVSKDAYE